MKMYRLAEIIELLKSEIDYDNHYVGFEIDDCGRLVMAFKTHAPDWRNADGIGEAVEEITLLESVGEY